ncbi:MAG: tetratricopeptide repeat protein [Planctomycetota bacterium]|jgi:tetratricopeptide (TPR) repeat protein
MIHKLKDCVQRLAERYELTYLEKHKGFVGIYRGVGVNVCESGGEITLSFFCPTADIGDQILEEFAGFDHWAEAGLPNAWIDALRELDANKPTITPPTSHRGCMVKIDKYRLKHIDTDKLMEIPEIIVHDLYEYGATETWVCDICKQDAATNAFLDGANASLCNRCWYEIRLAQKSKKRKSVLGPFCWTFLMVGALILVSIIWGTLKEPSGMDICDEGIEELENGNYNLAITYFTKAVRHEPNLAAAFALRANAYHNIEDYDAAIRDYTEAIRIVKPTLEELPKEQSAGIYNDRGFAYFMKDDYNRAIADYTKAIQFKQDFADAYINRGEAYVTKQMYDDAIADYNEAIRLDSNNVLAYVYRGEACNRKGEYDNAIADCTKALELDPKNPQAYYERGFAHFGKEEYNLAIVECTEAIRLDPQFSVAYMERGVAYYRKSNYDKALADFTEVARLVPNYAVAYIERCRVYYNKQEYDKSWQDVHKAQSLGFEFPPEFLKDLREASGREK